MIESNTKKCNDENDNINEPLHYILKLGNDYYHQTVICSSIEDMENKAKTLEGKFGPMELNIRVKKKGLVIHSVKTEKSSMVFDNNLVECLLETGILFNPPLTKQINKFRAEIEKVKTIENLLDDTNYSYKYNETSESSETVIELNIGTCLEEK